MMRKIAKLTNNVKITDIPVECIAIILSYLSYEDFLEAKNTCYDFFASKEFSLKMKMSDEFGINWEKCEKTFGKDNLCAPIIAYKHFCYQIPLWLQINDFCKENHLKEYNPYVLGCILKKIPDSEHEEYFKNVKAILEPLFIDAQEANTNESKLSESTIKYVMYRVASFCGNVSLTRFLVEYAETEYNVAIYPNKDCLNIAAKIGATTLVKYIVGNAKRFSVNPCMSTLHDAVKAQKLPTAKYLIEICKLGPWKETLAVAQYTKNKAMIDYISNALENANRHHCATKIILN